MNEEHYSTVKDRPMPNLTEEQKSSMTRCGYIGKNFNGSGARRNTREMRKQRRKSQRVARRHA